MSTESKKIVIIGSGNVATHLAKILIKKGHEIVQFIGRNEIALKDLSLKYLVSFTTDFTKLNTNADIYLICVSDDEIEQVAKQLKLKDKLILHTSGSVSLNSIQQISSKTGVLYPLQTISKDDKLKWSKIPLLIEGFNKEVEQEIMQFASTISKKITVLNSNQREKMHLAAVMVNNFSNHLSTLANEFLEKEKAPYFKLLFPLMQQTIKKSKNLNPSLSQTGPAKRNDKKVISKHLGLLKKHPETAKVYSCISESITNYHHGKLQGKTK
jgi:predicted short-subunit dehydrogenase-like oxidoreductase (DUF2520 family)